MRLLYQKLVACLPFWIIQYVKLKIELENQNVMKLREIFSHTVLRFHSDALTRVNQEQWVYGIPKYHGLYGSGLIAALMYCFQNSGGTTLKTLPDA